jgi:hypothetical protein
MLRSVMCTCPQILENRIIPLTYEDTLVYKAFSLFFAKVLLNKCLFIDNKMTYGDLELRILC